MIRVVTENHNGLSHYFSVVLSPVRCFGRGVFAFVLLLHLDDFMGLGFDIVSKQISQLIVILSLRARLYRLPMHLDCRKHLMLFQRHAQAIKTDDFWAVLVLF